MHTTSLEVSKRLFEVFGWKDCHNVYINANKGVDFSTCVESEDFSANPDNIPAYDSDYLLEKLPKGCILRTPNNYSEVFQAGYRFNQKNSINCKASTPADALCLLAIKLKEEGVM